MLYVQQKTCKQNSHSISIISGKHIGRHVQVSDIVSKDLQKYGLNGSVLRIFESNKSRRNGKPLLGVDSNNLHCLRGPQKVSSVWPRPVPLPQNVPTFLSQFN